MNSFICHLFQYFRLKVKNPDHAIAPGLEVSALVEYYTTRAEDAQDRVVLVADNDVVEIPLIALVKFLTFIVILVTVELNFLYR